MTNVTFREEDHTYFNAAGEILISVTQLMQEMGLAPNYDGVSETILARKAERGTLVHKEIENYIKNNLVGFTEELGKFIAYIQTTKREIAASEMIVASDKVAGTIDLIFRDGTIADIKTTYSLHKEAISWQLSLYRYLYRACDNSIEINKGQAFWLPEHSELDEMQVVDIPLKSYAACDALIADWLVGRKRHAVELKGADEALNQLVAVQTQYEALSAQKKQIEATLDAIKKKVIVAMKENGVISWENEKFRLSYIPATTARAVDSKRLKKERPDIYNEFSTTVPKREFLRVVLKKERKRKE